MASQQPPRRPRQPPATPAADPRRIDFDPRRLKLPQAAIVGFAIGIFFHACVIFAVLDDGSSAGGGPAVGGETREEVTLPQATPTGTPVGDRTDCAAIRQTEYRSEAERQWFLANCIGG